MAWSSSNRRRELPPDWEAIKRSIFARDNRQCQRIDLYGDKCLSTKWLECHHKGSPLDHSPENLVTYCRECHRIETHKQSAKARAANAARIANSYRRREDHPGLILKPAKG